MGSNVYIYHTSGINRQDAPDGEPINAYEPRSPENFRDNRSCCAEAVVEPQSGSRQFAREIHCLSHPSKINVVPPGRIDVLPQAAMSTGCTQQWMECRPGWADRTYLPCAIRGPIGTTVPLKPVAVVPRLLMITPATPGGYTRCVVNPFCPILKQT